jgi:hypothetical protein
VLLPIPQIVKWEPKPESSPEEMLFVVQGSELGLTMVTAEVTYGLKQARYIFWKKIERRE